MGTAFGGGIGMTGDTCGVVTGALLLLGLKYGTSDVNDRISKSRVYQVADEFIKAFEARKSSTKCRELLGFDIKSGNHPESDEIISRRCPVFVKTAMEIVEEITRSENGEINKQD